MIDVIDVGDRLDGHIVLDGVAVSGLDRDGPFAGFRAQQDYFARLLIMHHQRVRVSDDVDRWRRAGADVVDYVALARIQSECHGRAVVGEQQAGLKQQHADSCDQPRKQYMSLF